MLYIIINYPYVAPNGAILTPDSHDMIFSEEEGFNFMSLLLAALGVGLFGGIFNLLFCKKIALLNQDEGVDKLKLEFYTSS